MLSATDREILTVWVVACVENARAAVEARRLGQVVKTKDGNVVNNPHLGIVNRQAFIMIRAAGELGFTPSPRASLGMMDEGEYRGPRLIGGEVNPFDEFRS
jgi:P27 family predicted phage terminase small subunit